jgi:3-oxoacyl-[acyl-carrier-protein] synthase II
VKTRPVFITGVGLDLPDTSSPESLTGPALSTSIERDPGVLRRKLGRGLTFKDHATRLALSAAHDALVDAGLPVHASEQRDQPRIGVAASSNFGNLDTVCRVAGTIGNGHVRDTSPLDLPNASSNVIASSIALRFGCKGLNLMFCSGGCSGVHAVHVLANAIRAGRIDRAIVVGVEVRNEFTSSLWARTVRAWLGADALVPPLVDGAAALLLESETSARARGVRPYAVVGPSASAPASSLAATLSALAHSVPGALDVWFTPNLHYPALADRVEAAWSTWARRPPAREDIAAIVGESYGVSGVLQCLRASTRLRASKEASAIVTSGGACSEATASLLITRPPTEWS